MPPIRSIDLSDGVLLDITGYGTWLESKLNIQDRLAGVAGNLKKKEEKFNSWLMEQEPFSYIFALADYPSDHRVRQEPPDLRVWETIDGTDIIVVNFYVAVHFFDDSPLTYTVRTQNREMGPITGEWW